MLRGECYNCEYIEEGGTTVRGRCPQCGGTMSVIEDSPEALRDRWISEFNRILEGGYVAKKSRSSSKSILIGNSLVKNKAILITPEQNPYPPGDRGFDILLTLFEARPEEISEGDKFETAQWEERYSAGMFEDLITFLKEGSRMGFRDEWVNKKVC